MKFRGRPLGLRHRLVLAFSVVALLVSTVFAVSTYLLARGYLLAQRERVVQHQMFADATFVQRRLQSAGADVSAVLTAAGTPAGHTIILKWRGQWYASAFDQGRDAVPAGVREQLADGRAASQRFRSSDGPSLAVGVPVPAVEAEFYEIAPLTDLDSNLRLLSAILIGGALLATAPERPSASGQAGRSSIRSTASPSPPRRSRAATSTIGFRRPLILSWHRSSARSTAWSTHCSNASTTMPGWPPTSVTNSDLR